LQHSMSSLLGPDPARAGIKRHDCFHYTVYPT
jgi:hypothetical protein